jgi:pfkB family carbohydrate kinase
VRGAAIALFRLTLEVWSTPQQARQTILQTVRLVDVLKVSSDELEFLAGTHDPAEACRDLRALGPRLAVVTLGSEGCSYDSGSSRGWAPETLSSVACCLVSLRRRMAHWTTRMRSSALCASATRLAPSPPLAMEPFPPYPDVSRWRHSSKRLDAASGPRRMRISGLSIGDVCARRKSSGDSGASRIRLYRRSADTSRRCELGQHAGEANTETGARRLVLGVAGHEALRGLCAGVAAAER